MSTEDGGVSGGIFVCQVVHLAHIDVVVAVVLAQLVSMCHDANKVSVLLYKRNVTSEPLVLVTLLFKIILVLVS